MAAQGASNVPLLAVDELSKSFGPLKAVDAVSLAIEPGSIHALLGENGAGKSTLVKMLYGTLQPDAGRIAVRGDVQTVGSPNQARALGIGMVFQHFSLFESMSVAENIALALDHKPTPEQVTVELAAFGERYGLAVDPGATIGDLDVGVRQRVEILRVLLQKPSLVILDEPTSVLTPQEAESLFGVLRQLASEGKGILYISHKLDEVRALCDAATVMRQGKVVARTDPREETAASLARAMVGSDVSTVERRSSGVPADAPILLELNQVRYDPGTLFGVALKDVSLQVRAGEVMGIAGVAGNGQKELFDVLSGEADVDLDALRLQGKPIGTQPIAKRRQMGAAFIPEERAGHASVPAMALSENALITRKLGEDGTLGALGVVNFPIVRKLSQAIRSAFDVRSAPGDPAAGTLSGGNLQKYVVGRELSRAPKLVVVNQPTWGVDAAAASFIRRELVDLAEKGSAIIVISQDLDELLQISDRIAVLSHGALSEPRDASTVTLEELGLLMGGDGSAVPSTEAPSKLMDAGQSHAA
ncbi:MAG: ABC transporter ATP-binding protein [Devosiaceae bacterium]|nr:ABC transporter ATP-binding protein [Devosiaceae bacterium MH13]